MKTKRLTRRQRLERELEMLRKDRTTAVVNCGRLVEMKPQHKGSYETQLKVVLEQLDEKVEEINEQL